MSLNWTTRLATLWGTVVLVVASVLKERLGRGTGGAQIFTDVGW